MKTTLQTIRKYARNPNLINTGKNDNKPVFYYFGELLPEQWCDDVYRGIEHTGWFTRADGTTFKDGSGKCRGIVVSLPAAPGFPNGRHLAGYWWGDNDERVLWPELYLDAETAAWPILTPNTWPKKNANITKNGKLRAISKTKPKTHCTACGNASHCVTGHAWRICAMKYTT